MEKNITKKTDNFVVVKHNFIIEANYMLTAYEQRILLFCISKIDSIKPITDEMTFVVSVNDMAELCGNEEISGSAYDNLKAAANRLFSRYVTVTDTTRSSEPFVMRWAYVVYYSEKKGEVTLKFGKDSAYYLSNLSKNFTQYKLKDVIGFRSIYSYRFYEFFSRWGGNDKTLDIEWLREKLELGEKFKSLRDFKKDVVDIAIKEINEFSNISVSYETVKRGKHVVAFKFTYSIAKVAKVSKRQQLQLLSPQMSEPTKTKKMDNFEYYAGLIRQCSNNKTLLESIIKTIPDDIKAMLKDKKIL